MYHAIMSAKPVQISMPVDLLRQVDADPEAREKGRSAFIRSAVRLYLTAKERHDVETSLARAYSGEADALLGEIADLIGEQAWPND